MSILANGSIDERRNVSGMVKDARILTTAVAVG